MQAHFHAQDDGVCELDTASFMSTYNYIIKVNSSSCIDILVSKLTIA